MTECKQSVNAIRAVRHFRLAAELRIALNAFTESQDSDETLSAIAPGALLTYVIDRRKKVA